MKKSDLKTGYTIECRSGERSKVLLNTSRGDITAGNSEDEKKAWRPLSAFNNDLTNGNYPEDDIVKVYDITKGNDMAASLKHVGKLLWERKEETIYTIDGIEYSESTLRSMIKKATS